MEIFRPFPGPVLSPRRQPSLGYQAPFLLASLSPWITDSWHQGGDSRAPLCCSQGTSLPAGTDQGWKEASRKWWGGAGRGVEIWNPNESGFPL